MGHNDRNVIIDFWKFFCAIIVSLLHYDWNIVPHGYLCVEFFFISSGFMIYIYRRKYEDISLFTYGLNKLRSIYIYWTMMIAIAVFYQAVIQKIGWSVGVWILRIVKMLLFIPYLLEDRVTNSDSFWLPFGHLWYIPTWLFASIVCVAIIKCNLKNRKYLILLLTFILVSTLYNSTENHMLNMTQEIMVGSTPFGVFRAVQDEMFGMLMGIIFEYLRENQLLNRSNGGVLMTILNIGAVSGILIIFL